MDKAYKLLKLGRANCINFQINDSITGSGCQYLSGIADHKLSCLLSKYFQFDSWLNRRCCVELMPNQVDPDVKLGWACWR